MRRLARRLFALCSAVSLLLGVAACVMWVWPHAAGRGVRVNKGLYAAGEYETRMDPDGGGRFVLDVAPYPVGRPVSWTERAVRRELFPATTRAGLASPESLNALLQPNSGPAFGSTSLWSLPDERLALPGVRWVDYFRSRTGQIISREFTVACWLPAVLFAVLPAVYLVRHRRRARPPRPGACRVCGYDLRATPGRCPECGTAAVSD